MRQVKFYGKNVNESKYADLVYIGSLQTEAWMIHHLISLAESIGGPIYGPLVCMIEGEPNIKVLKF